MAIDRYLVSQGTGPDCNLVHHFREPDYLLTQFNRVSITHLCFDHTQRRRRDRVIKTNTVGAKAAIQSQWTNLPKSGLTTALRITADPTKAPAQTNATGQLRFTNTCRGFAPPDFLPAPTLFLLTGFFMVTYSRFTQVRDYCGYESLL